MSLSHSEFLDSVGPVIVGLYLLGCAGNLGAAVAAGRRRHVGRTLAWAGLAGLFGWLAWSAWTGHPPELSPEFKAAADRALGPVTLSVGTLVGLIVFHLGRRGFVIPAVAWTALNVSVVWLGMSLTDANFAAIVLKPDNLPIVAMIYLLGFFTWLATAQAVENDRRLAAGQPPTEHDYRQTVLVWPDAVYVELILAVIATVLLVVWSLLVRAPLEAPANPAVTPNPSKAPWYFLGLQEMLVYFAPWMAGVTVPALIIFGLMAIPYLDPNPKGSGYYTIRQRPWVYLVFQFGFLQLWVLLIVIGTFMRGPNWSFFGLYEHHDPARLAEMTNTSLAEYFWTGLLGRSVPAVPAGAGWLVELGHILWREAAGIAAMVLYFVGLPVLLRYTVLRDAYRQMGRARYVVMSLLLVTMLSLPLKMILNWTIHLSYVVNIPEYFFYF
jgi:hypothetical protein